MVPAPITHTRSIATSAALRGRSEVVRVAAEALAAVRGHEEVVLEPQPPAALPVDARLDRQHHPLADLTAAGPVRPRRPVGAPPNAGRHRGRRLAGGAP